MTNFEFFDIRRRLRKSRFKKTWTTRAGDCRMDEWKREEPDGRTLICQLWHDGAHRMTHEWCGCSDTKPTSFVNEQQLEAAIVHESTRKDSKFSDPTQHYHLPAREFLLRKQMAAAHVTTLPPPYDGTRPEDQG